MGTRGCSTKTFTTRSTGTITRCTCAASRASSIAAARSCTLAAASDSGPSKACDRRPTSCGAIESTTLVAIGGDGTFRGCLELAHYWDGRVIGCPGTIDNDLSGTDVSIGFTSAVSTAAEAVDKIRDTADATERLFLVEVMGRHSGQIAIYTALATGADAALIPEVPHNVDEVVERLKDEQRSGKTSWIVIVAEGAIDRRCASNRAGAQRPRLDIRHSPPRARAPPARRRPAVRDRILASRMGAFAVDALHDGQSMKMVGEIQGELVLTSFEQTTSRPKIVPTSLVTLLTDLAR